MGKHRLYLPEGEVHLWHFQTHHSQDSQEPSLSCLDEQEYQRYQRYLSPVKRHQFAWGRTMLKEVLARYLANPAENIRLFYTEGQKPFLKGDLSFNLSHAGPHILIGVARHPIGVDIQDEENLQVKHVWQGLSVAEQQQIPQEDLFRYWVLKEALWKADNQQSDPAPLLDAIAAYQLQSPHPFSFLLEYWYAGYCSPLPNIHLGWVVQHPHPVCKLNGRLLEFNSRESSAYQLQEVLSSPEGTYDQLFSVH